MTTNQYIVLAILGAIVLLIPTLVAHRKANKHGIDISVLAIFIVNVFSGVIVATAFATMLRGVYDYIDMMLSWTLVGWMVALVMALMTTKKVAE